MILSKHIYVILSKHIYVYTHMRICVSYTPLTLSIATELELVFTNHSFKSTSLRAPLGDTDNGNTRLLGSHLPIGYWRKSDDDIPSMSECGVCRLVLKEKNEK